LWNSAERKRWSGGKPDMRKKVSRQEGIINHNRDVLF